MQIRELPSTTTVSSSDYLVKQEITGATEKISVGDFVVDNLTSGGPTVPLSAEQGKNLNISILSKADYVDLEEKSSIEAAFDALTIYDKPVLVSWQHSGKRIGIMYKYTGGQYGMAWAQAYSNNTIMVMSVVGGVKTVKNLIAT